MITGPKSHFVRRCRERGYEWAAVAACVLSDDGTTVTVDETHPAYPRASQPAASGPGTELKALLAKFGITSTPTCGCNKMARQMDIWGPEECFNHIEEIVDVMEETAKKRRLPFLRTAGRLLVRKAIRNAKRKATGT